MGVFKKIKKKFFNRILKAAVKKVEISTFITRKKNSRYYNALEIIWIILNTLLAKVN